MAATDWLSQGTLILASNNKGKIAEFEKLFAELQLPVEVVAQGKLNIEDAIEDGLSFVENAIIKARHASKISGKPAIADDSGICVPVLGGAPGIYSARYSGEHGNDAANNEKLQADLKPLRQDGEVIEGLFAYWYWFNMPKIPYRKSFRVSGTGKFWKLRVVKMVLAMTRCSGYRNSEFPVQK